MKIGLIGASGFIGLRTAEIVHLRALAEIRPIVRSAASLAVLSRMSLDWRICPLLDLGKLTAALRGCDVCVHAAIGDAAQIVNMAKVTYRACANSGIRRLVWLSSASVHGQNPASETDEANALRDDQPFTYNNAKVRAEWALQRCADDRSVGVVTLQPSIVFGPRSRWVADTAEDLVAGRAAWINGGRGICNSVYVDNLVEAIWRALITRNVDGNAFLISDAETVTWRDFCLPIAKHLGYDASAFTELQVPKIPFESESRFAAFTQTRSYARVSHFVPDRAKRVVKAIARAWPEPPPAPSVWVLRMSSDLKLTPEMALLQQCQWKLPYAKAERLLGYYPIVTFAEGMRRSLAWLDFCGIKGFNEQNPQMVGSHSGSL